MTLSRYCLSTSLGSPILAEVVSEFAVERWLGLEYRLPVRLWEHGQMVLWREEEH